MGRRVNRRRGVAAARAFVVLAAVGGCLAAVGYAAIAPRGGARLDAPAASRLTAGLPTVRITGHPQMTATSSTARFAFLARGLARRFECKVDSARWRPCTTPAVYRGLRSGSHAFSVRVRAGTRHGPASSYRWTLLEPRGFSIEPRLGDLPALFPGAAPTQLPLTLSNPNPVPILVTAVSVAIAAEPPGCESGANFQVLPSSASAAAPVLVPAGGSVDLPSEAGSAPAIGLRERPLNQDACQGGRLSLLFDGEARG